MAKQAMVVRQGEGESLAVMGAGVRFLCSAAGTEQAWSLMQVDLPPEAGPPPHTHPWDEAYYVVAGQVRFALEGREQLVGAGDFIYAPAGTLHGFSGASADPARMLIFDREVKGPADMPKVPEIGLRHQIDFRRP